MGKHFWMRHLNESNSNKQPGCMMLGLAHVLDYHHWHSNVRKMIQLRKYEDRSTLDKPSTGDWSPESKMYSPEDDADETEKLLVENESPFLSNKRSRATKKTYLKARKKPLSGEENSRDRRRSKCLKPSLQRTYSIHHLKSVNDDINISRITGKVDSDDVLEIFKVDKELLVKRLQEAGISKSTSFPAVSERRKLKTVKLESMHKETRLFPVENKIEMVKKTTPRSLNESADKYAQLFENSFRTDIAKLSVSKSLKLSNEHGHHAPLYFRRIRSLSNVDSCYNFNQEFEVLPDGLRSSEEENVNSLVISSENENVALDANMQIHENDAGLRLFASEEDDGFVSGLDTGSVQETESRALDHQVSEGLERMPTIHDSILSSIDSDCTLKLENNEISDLHYVRHLLDRSGIAVDPCGMTWHSSDQPFGPQLFEEVESCWPHEQDQIENAWPDFCGCWHHQMLFDLVNEVLAEVYDLSLPYYPKPLSSSCRVRTFPGGDHIIEDVCMSIGESLSMELHDQKQSLDDIVGRDLAHDQCWMNLQLETESVALYFEDMIFDELLEEVLLS